MENAIFVRMFRKEILLLWRCDVSTEQLYCLWKDLTDKFGYFSLDLFCIASLP